MPRSVRTSVAEGFYCSVSEIATIVLTGLKRGSGYFIDRSPKLAYGRSLPRAVPTSLADGFYHLLNHGNGHAKEGHQKPQ